jgi:2-polyprenyl-3-methyl-5-hydroxy-6-metoxy-1,4-benzoquinol methylase
MRLGRHGQAFFGEARNTSDNLYRRRIYRQYVTATSTMLAPTTVQDFRPRAPDLCKLIRQYFPPDREANILDLGCGHGALIYFARRSGYRNIRGIDCSPQQVAVAQRLGMDDVQQGDLLETLRCLAEKSIDCIVTFDVIEHFTKSELLVFIDDVSRILRDGGRWIIHAPNGESPFCGRMLYGDFTHEIAFTRQSLPQLLLASGFTTVECHSDILAVTGYKRILRWVIWTCICGMLRLWVAAETGDNARDAIFSQNLLAIAFK